MCSVNKTYLMMIYNINTVIMNEMKCILIVCFCFQNVSSRKNGDIRARDLGYRAPPKLFAGLLF